MPICEIRNGTRFGSRAQRFVTYLAFPPSNHATWTKPWASSGLTLLDGVGRLGSRVKFGDFREVGGALLPWRVEVELAHPPFGTILTHAWQGDGLVFWTLFRAETDGSFALPAVQAGKGTLSIPGSEVEVAVNVVAGTATWVRVP